MIESMSSAPLQVRFPADPDWITMTERRFFRNLHEGIKITTVEEVGMEPLRLEYDDRMKAYPIGCVIVFLVLLVLIWIGIRPESAAPSEGGWIFVTLCAIMIVLPWLFFVEVYGRSIVLDDAGVRVSSGWRRGGGFLRWADVDSVSVTGGAVRLLSLGRHVTIPTGLPGEERFWSAVRKKVPAEKFDKRTLRHLHTIDMRCQIDRGE